MAKAPLETLTKLEKIKPRPGLQRRNSTGGVAIFSEPIPIPNYLRASIGSCHDVCKYGTRKSSPGAESQPSRNIITKPEVKPSTNLRVKSVPESKNLSTNDRVKKVSEPKNLGFPSYRRNPNETLKSTFNARAVWSDVEIKRPKRTSPLPRSPSPSAPQPSASKLPVTKTRRSMSLPKKIGPAKILKRTEKPKKTEGESVEEKSIRVVEAKDESQNEGFVSSSDQKQETGSEANDDSSSPTKAEEVDPSSPTKAEEVDPSSPTKAEEVDPSSPIKAEEVEREEVLEPKIEFEDEAEEDESKGGRVLRRAFSEGGFDNKENEKGMRIVVEMGKDKVKALVHAFETLITT